MIKIEQAIIVEGKYDKIKVSSFIDAVIIVTNGFGIFTDREKLELIRFYAMKTGIVILTDSDKAGFAIRNHIKGAVKFIMFIYLILWERKKEKLNPLRRESSELRALRKI